MRKFIKIELALMEQVYRNHRLAYKQGTVHELLSRAKLCSKLAEGLALSRRLVIEGPSGEIRGDC